MDPEWDSMWTLLIGPRRAGKTTLGKYLCQKLISKGEYKELLYLNCDYASIREWLKSPVFISKAIKLLGLTKPILFIDEVQRLENAGLLLKAIIDLNLPIKHIATGSSQLEIKSKVQEFLTGRQLSSLILPLSHQEWDIENALDQVLLYGCYPQVLRSTKKEMQLREIYQRYIQKDIIEILKIANPDTFETLIRLIAHRSGQLVNYNQLATDCKINNHIIRNHLDVLEQTFILEKITPFVGNKRTEITSNPIYYFIDNGFRNTSLRNFTNLESRSDLGLLAESLVFQEIHKFRSQNYLSFDIHFWRTKSGAEVDFILYKNSEEFIPIEVKYQNMKKPTLTRSFRSFLEAYKPRQAIMVTKDTIDTLRVHECTVHFIPISYLSKMFEVIQEQLNFATPST